MDWTARELQIVRRPFDEMSRYRLSRIATINGEADEVIAPDAGALLAAIDTLLRKLEPLSPVGAQLACIDEPNPFATLDRLVRFTDEILHAGYADQELVDRIRVRRARVDDTYARLAVIAIADQEGRLTYSVIDIESDPTMPTCPDFIPETL